MTNNNHEKILNTFLSKGVSTNDVETSVKISQDVISLIGSLSTIEKNKIDPMLQISLIKLREIIDKKID